jgi:hypothetical protein
MSLGMKFDATDAIDREISLEIAKNFEEIYDFLDDKGLFVPYPDSEFKVQGIPSLRQVIAWRKLIKLLGKDNIPRLFFTLNYLKDENKILFIDKFLKHFPEKEDRKNLEVTFTCGYFSRYNSKRRKKILDFVINNMLEENVKVNIWTQDKTLKDDFKDTFKTLNKPFNKKLKIKVSLHRIDIHYTLFEVKDKNGVSDASCLFLELPHTESHNFRLETFMTYKDIKEFKSSSVDKIKKFLKKQRSFITPFKSFLSVINYAFNVK